MDRQKNAEPKFWANGYAISEETWYYIFNFQEICIMAAKKPFTEREQKQKTAYPVSVVKSVAIFENCGYLS